MCVLFRGSRRLTVTVVSGMDNQSIGSTCGFQIPVPPCVDDVANVDINIRPLNV